MVLILLIFVGLPALVGFHLWATERAWHAGYNAAQTYYAPAVAADATADLIEGTARKYKAHS